MAREINSRIKISGTLRAETPLHVGGYGASIDTDLPLARNGKDELYIPGTSIAGVLRAWCEKRLNDKNFLIEVFGFQETDKRRIGTARDRSHASYVLIEDAIITLPQSLSIEIRDGVGINRFYGVAADKTKFDRAVLPKGSKINFEMTVEIGEDLDEAKTKAVFGQLLLTLQEEKIRFGAAKTRGLGRVKLVALHEIQVQDFSNILEWILLDGTGKKLTGENEIKAEIDDKLNSAAISRTDVPTLTIKVEWKPRLPLMVKAGYEGIAVDMLPVTSGVDGDKLSLVLAGSSIKGAFRSHAERIIRTLLYCNDKSLPNCEARNKNFETKNKDFNDQLDGVPFVEELFGARKKTGSLNPRLGLGALAVDDCYSEESFDADKWREVEQAQADSDETFNTLLSKLGEVEKTNLKFYPTVHNAIDRFTGGTAEGALYSVLAPTDVKWQPIILTLDFARTENSARAKNPLCCLMLLLLVLRDLAEYRLPLGFATNRGMGEIEIENIHLAGKNLTAIGLPEELSINLPKGNVRDIPADSKKLLSNTWKAEVENVRNTIA